DNLSAVLKTSNSILESVVVTGYQTVKKSETTGSTSNIGGKEIAQKPIGSFVQLLQGKSTGVQVTGTSGRPGANAIIRVRGTGSINASSEPLIIVDGLPISSAAFNLLSANDIENVTVLKDASASAIYGSRAGNGVIVVTTKRGSAGKPEVRYSFQYGISNAQDLKNVRLMSPQEKLQYEYELGYTNLILDSMIRNRGYVIPAGVSPIKALSDAQREDLWNLAISRGAGDWRPIFIPQGIQTTHEIAMSGADDKFRYYFSLNKSKKEGNEYASYWNRTSGRLNVEYKAKEWLRTGINLGVSHSRENIIRERFNNQNSYAGYFLTNSYEPVYLADGKTYNPTNQGLSPLEQQDDNPRDVQRISTFGTLFGEITALKHLSLKSQIGANYNTLKDENYIIPGTPLAAIFGLSSGDKTDQGNQDFVYVFTNTANWRQSFNEKHNINVLVGQEFTKQKFYSYLAEGRVFPTPSVNTLDNAGTPFKASTSRTQYALISYFANVAYDFSKKYFLNLSGRRDGSSRFGKDNRFANFWAIGAAWDLAKESFFKINAINNLKIKGSIGTAGNFNIGNYTSLGTYALTTKYNDLPTAVPNQLPNPNLTWETNRNYDLGLDFGLFNNRITGTLDYYKRKTDKLLFAVNVSGTTGFNSFQGNVGTVENKGFEVLLAGDLIRKRDLTWNVSVSYTHNDNNVLELFKDNQPAAGTSGLAYLKTGEPVFVYKLVKWAGIDPATGKNLFYKLDGTTTNTYSSSNIQILSGKSPNVKFYGSVNTSISYKGLDLSAQLYYSGGNYIFNLLDQEGANDGETKSIPQFTEAFNYWKKAGDNVRYANPLDPSQNSTFDTDKYLEKGDYVTLRDLTIGYTLPPSIASKIYLKGFRFYVQGTNLWVGTKYRGTPELGESNRESANNPGIVNIYGYPPLRAITFGIDVKF
ncbi:MAG: SusC/RagA family TonB-linked outer membrane protein, partial [Ginsengibacter sp.]